MKKVFRDGSTVTILGHYLYSKEKFYEELSVDELKDLEVQPTAADLSGDPLRVFLSLEALRYQFASAYDPFLAVNVSKIDPLPFQIDAVYNYILKYPRIRFLLADDPGAGKTIMAGLVIKELKLRKLADRILIVAPGHLMEQWRREMLDKFQEDFVVVRRDLLRSSTNVFQKYSQVIASIDFLKQDDVLDLLKDVTWDLVIVDEAHKLAAYKYGNKLSKTQRYRVGEVLSERTAHMLFLTATPHKGDPENFRLLVDLLLPGMFSDAEVLKEAIRSGAHVPFLRRMKEDLRGFDGKRLFPPRYSTTITYQLSDDEIRLYRALTEYIQTQYSQISSESKRRNVAFAMVILQRRFASSVYALLKSLERRKERLEEYLKNREALAEQPRVDWDSLLDELEDMEESERWAKEDELLGVTASKSPSAIKAEIETINKLISLARKVIESQAETKIQDLKQTLAKINSEFPGEKILLFTEFKDTLDYLTERLREWGYTVTNIHGQMSMEERLEKEKEFRHNAQIMVATEAAGEGINLQFCHLLVNYDIPWNPNRLEQRIGRVHRYGQKKPVYIYNLVAGNTREGEVLQRLLEKLEEIRSALGDKVFDVIGDVLHGTSLYKALAALAANLDDERARKEIEKVKSELDVDSISKKLEDLLAESLATKHIDLTRIRKMLEISKENRIAPEYLQEFFKTAMDVIGGRYRARPDGTIVVERIPSELKELMDAHPARWQYADLKFPLVITFDKDVAKDRENVHFVSFGHPILDALLDLIQRDFVKDLVRGAVFYDLDGMYDGPIWFYEVTIVDGNGQVAGKRLVAIYDSPDGLKPVNPRVIWDFEPARNVSVSVDFSRRKVVEEAVRSVANEYLEELRRDRERQAEIKKNYGLRSLERLRGELGVRIARAEALLQQGDTTFAGILPLWREQWKKYTKKLQELPKEIERETTLRVSIPAYVGVIYVVPKDGMKSDPEIEKIGMRVTMEYERKRGWRPRDVSAENKGYDIVSEGPNGEVRYIEVKARAGIGDVQLTRNERVVAGIHGEKYWLYVVFNAATNPELRIIQNPAEVLRMQEIREVRYIAPASEILNKGERADI